MKQKFSEKRNLIRDATATNLFVKKDESELVFNTDKGQIVIIACSQVSSESWFSDIEGVENLFNSLIIEFEEISMEGYDVNDGRGRQDVDIAYGYKITTEAGEVTIVFRNSSNGEYIGYTDVRLFVRCQNPGTEWFDKYRHIYSGDYAQIYDDWMAV